MDRATRTNRGALSAWTITLAATAASTYALDAMATAAGVLLVASGLLSGLAHPLGLASLAATYVLWGVSLRANLAASWLLLRRTGTRTNARPRPQRSISPTTWPQTSPRSSAGSPATPPRTTGARSCASRSNAKASGTRPTRTSRGARRSPAPRSRERFPSANAQRAVVSN
jgi:hypothetical protein